MGYKKLGHGAGLFGLPPESFAPARACPATRVRRYALVLISMLIKCGSIVQDIPLTTAQDRHIIQACLTALFLDATEVSRLHEVSPPGAKAPEPPGDRRHEGL